MSKNKNQKRVNVTVAELGEILWNTPVTGVTFASVLQATQPKMLQKHRVTKLPSPYHSVLKISKVAIILNSDYETAVTNQLEREAKDAENYDKGKNTMPLKFGKNNNFIGVFNDEYVLQYRPNDNVKVQTTYIANGKRTDKSKLEAYLPASRPATNQGTDREILWRKLYLSNVLRLTLNGTEYNVIG